MIVLYLCYFIMKIYSAILSVSFLKILIMYVAMYVDSVHACI